MNPDNETHIYYGHETTEQQSRASQSDPKAELKAAIRGSNEVLVSAKTVFPFVIFPDTLIVDREKLAITKRTFFKTGEVMCIRIEDILNATANVGPIFGSIKISSRIMSNEKPYTVSHFWRDDALRVQKILHGYIIALEKKIDCSDLEIRELTQLLENLGSDDYPRG